QEWIDRFVRGPRILEMGCSDGTSTRFLLAKAQSLYVIDGAAEYCDIVRKNLSDPRLRITQTLFEQYVPEAPFDDIVLARGLDYIESPVKLLKQINLWLRPGGRFHLVVQNAQSLHRRLGVALGLMPKIDHLNELSL